MPQISWPDRSPALVPAPPAPGMTRLVMGQLTVRLAQDASDLRAVTALRGQRFHRDDATAGPDCDDFDLHSLHLMVESADSRVLATARLRLLVAAADFAGSYAAQSYDLHPVARTYGRALEIGRLCLAAGAEPAPQILRALFAGMTALALDTQAQVLMGCASFPGADPARHDRGLAQLRDHHLGPVGSRPAPCTAQVWPFATLPAGTVACARDLPPLLRMYLAMGGWVSDFAVIDRDLDTLHVLVAVPVATIPPARLRVLAALVATAPLSLT